MSIDEYTPGYEFKGYVFDRFEVKQMFTFSVDTYDDFGEVVGLPGSFVLPTHLVERCRDFVEI